MKKIVLIHIMLLSFFLPDSVAQGSGENVSGLNVSLGAAATYYYGPGSRNFGKFEDGRVNWQINSMLGYAISSDKEGKKTMIAVFGNYGLNNGGTVDQLISDQDYNSSANAQASSNNYYQLEAGLLIAEIIRISTGVGQQNFDSQNLTSSSGPMVGAKMLKYSSSTVGFRFKLGNVSWLIDCNFAYGKDFNNTVITPSTGLMFHF